MLSTLFLILTLLFSLVPIDVVAEIVSKVTFSETFTPEGWTRFDASKFTSHVLFSDIPNTARVPDPFRGFVRRSSGFGYDHSVPSATSYTITLGFIETMDDICSNQDRKRQFYATVNNIRSQLIDIYSNVGCFTPYTVTIKNIPVSNDKLMRIRLSPSGTRYPPLLSNFIVESENDGPPAPPVSSPAPPVSSPPSKSLLPSPSSVSSVQPVNIFSIDAGSTSDDGSLVTGNSSKSVTVYNIKGLSKKMSRRYSRHRYGLDFRYNIPVNQHNFYHVRLSFAETSLTACKPRFRRFNVYVYDAANSVSTAKIIKNINIFNAVGCRSAYQVSIENVPVRDSTTLVVRFIASRRNAIISAIDVYTKSDKTIPKTSSTPTSSPTSQKNTPTPSSSNDRQPDATDTLPVQIDVGSSADQRLVSKFPIAKLETKKRVVKTKLGTSAAYQTARSGRQFQYKFDLPPGGYIITLGFAEIDPNLCLQTGTRVFNVYVNDQLQLEGVDIFKQVGCNRGLERSIAHTVSVINRQQVVIRFERIIGDAILNLLLIHPSQRLCLPESSSGVLKDDHAAHALPGSYPPQLSSDSPKSYVDSDGDGFHKVRIDGTRSHTHFFDPQNNVVGRISSYIWTIVETGEIISRKSLFDHRFPLGVTRLKLTVIDNSCSIDEAETTVTVTASLQPGIYCYFYEGLSEVPLGGTLQSGPTPQFASEVPGLRFSLPNFDFKTSLFAMRCNLLLEVSTALRSATIKFSTFGTGHARVYKGKDLTIDTQQSSEAVTELPVGITSFEITYLRLTRALPPKLKFVVNQVVPGDNVVFYERRMVLPILTSLSPSEGQISGGTTIRVSGYGLYQPLDIFFGSAKLKPLQSDQSNTQFLVTSTAAPAGSVDVFVKSPNGKKSNVLKFRYGSSCDSVSFETRQMSSKKGILTFNFVPTCVEIWQDQKLYMGCVDGSVRVIGYDRKTLRVNSHCYSKPLVDNRFKNPEGAPASRSVLGIAFHPADTEPRPHVSTSTLYAHDRERISLNDKRAWMNGAVDRLKSGSDSKDGMVCLVYDKTIVQNLPVSNHDHSVSSLLFDQNGDLLIGVGSMTNAGLPGYKLGSWWENDMSSAILIAPLSKPSFNGRLVYKYSDQQYKARKRRGDVEVYASGTRNPFGMSMTSNGDIYATDQGVNCAFGQIAGNCNHYDEEKAATWDMSADWPGGVKPQTGGCGSSATRPDKVLYIERGAFYGHANLARGPEECAWIDPFSDMTARGGKPPKSYQSPLMLVPSSVTGIHEYRGNHFCGSLRGDLLLSAYKGGSTYRMSVSKRKILVKPYQLFKGGGLSFAENAHGELVFPQYNRKNIYIMTPRITAATQLNIVGVAPFRHGLKGGTLLTIGGNGFARGTTVSVGGRGCTVRSWTSVELQCVVPAAPSGGQYDVSVKEDKSEAILKNAVLYMNV